jgi:hypothetical protein
MFEKLAQDLAGPGPAPYSLAIAARLASSISTMTMSGSGRGTMIRERTIASKAVWRMLDVT